MSKYNVGDYFYCKKENEADVIEKLQSEGELVLDSYRKKGSHDLVFIKIYSETPYFAGFAWARHLSCEAINKKSQRLKNNITSEFFGENMNKTKGNIITASENLIESIIMLRDGHTSKNLSAAISEWYEICGEDSFRNYVHILDPDLDLKRQIAEKEKELEELKAKLKR